MHTNASAMHMKIHHRADITQTLCTELLACLPVYRATLNFDRKGIRFSAATKLPGSVLQSQLVYHAEEPCQKAHRQMQDLALRSQNEQDSLLSQSLDSISTSPACREMQLQLYLTIECVVGACVCNVRTRLYLER